MASAWKKGGGIIMMGGKVILCDHCPCGPCTIVVRIDGWDHGRQDTSQGTNHTFEIDTGDYEVKEFSLSPDGIIDGESKIVATKKGVKVTFVNLGSGSDDSYGFAVSLVIYANKVKNPNFGISHSFSGSAASSEYDVTYSGSCTEDDDEDFE